MKQTILVIGANAAVARGVLPELGRGNKIITAGRSGCDVQCDVAKKVTIPAGVDVVINFAASFGGTDDKANAEALQVNVVGALNVCQAARAAKVRQVVLISSGFAALDESSPQFSWYALTKRQGDELAQYYCKQNAIPLAILRPPRLYGDSDDFAKNQPFLYGLINTAQLGEDIELYDTGSARRNYLHCADLAEIIRRVITQRIEGTYNCSYPTDVTYPEIAQAAQATFNNGGKVVMLKDKLDVVSDSFSRDCTLYEKIEYQPGISMQDGLQRIRQYRERGAQ